MKQNIRKNSTKIICILMGIVIIILSILLAMTRYELNKVNEVSSIYDDLLSKLMITEDEKIPVELIQSVIEKGEKSVDGIELTNRFIRIIHEKYDIELNENTGIEISDQSIIIHFIYKGDTIKNGVSIWHIYSPDGNINKKMNFKRYGLFYSLALVNGQVYKTSKNYSE